MSDWTFTPWSDNPYAPQIPYELYFAEKVNFAGPLISGIAYGIVIVLFFQCMSTLLNPVNGTRGGIKWGLVVHTVAMFTFITIFTVLGITPSAFINNRDYPGDDEYPPGPFGYELTQFANPLSALPSSMFYLNQWLADGLLASLYRCYIIYAMNYWAIVFPFLMYLVTLAMGIFIIYESWRPELSAEFYLADHIAIPYYSIALSLNVILTLMIVVRLALHSKNLRDAMGPLSRPDRLYRTIITVLVESSALYAINFVVYIGPWGAQKSISGVIFPLLAVNQVIAPFLITLRIANRTALTTETIATRDVNIGSLHFRSGRKSEGHETRSDRHPTTIMDASEDAFSEGGVGIETTIDEVRL